MPPLAASRRKARDTGGVASRAVIGWGGMWEGPAPMCDHLPQGGPGKRQGWGPGAIRARSAGRGGGVSKHAERQGWGPGRTSRARRAGRVARRELARLDGHAFSFRLGV